MSATPHRAAAAEPPVDAHMNHVVQLLKDGTARIIHLNRPKALNAMNRQMAYEFGQCLEVRPTTDPGDDPLAQLRHGHPPWRGPRAVRRR